MERTGKIRFCKQKWSVRSMKGSELNEKVCQKNPSALSECVQNCFGQGFARRVRNP